MRNTYYGRINCVEPKAGFNDLIMHANIKNFINDNMDAFKANIGVYLKSAKISFTKELNKLKKDNQKLQDRVEYLEKKLLSKKPL